MCVGEAPSLQLYHRPLNCLGAYAQRKCACVDVAGARMQVCVSERPWARTCASRVMQSCVGAVVNLLAWGDGLGFAQHRPVCSSGCRCVGAEHGEHGLHMVYKEYVVYTWCTWCTWCTHGVQVRACMLMLRCNQELQCSCAEMQARNWCK